MMFDNKENPTHSWKSTSRCLAMSPEVSFIVPAYNEERRIKNCLTALRRQTGTSFEIILVDNNCTDRTVDQASALCDQIVICREQGIGAARNAGAKQARGRFLAFIDADAEVSPGWLEAAVRQIKEGQLDSLSGWNYFTERNRFLFLYFNSYSVVFMMIFMISLLLRRPVVVGNNLLIERSLFFKVGGFPCCIAEDIKLSRTLNQIGASTAFCPRMRIAYSSRRLRHSGFIITMALWIRSVFKDIPEKNYRINYSDVNS
jgi:glycosyltransferase involved in cell wall biosynthesis